MVARVEDQNTYNEYVYPMPMSEAAQGKQMHFTIAVGSCSHLNAHNEEGLIRQADRAFGKGRCFNVDLRSNAALMNKGTQLFQASDGSQLRGTRLTTLYARVFPLYLPGREPAPFINFIQLRNIVLRLAPGTSTSTRKFLLPVYSINNARHLLPLCLCFI
jgi:hypothetical protein